MQIKPNKAQQRALNKLKKQKREGKSRFLVVLPSGIGKTYLSAFETDGFKGKVLYLAHRNELLQQGADVFQEVQGIDESQIGFANEDRKDFGAKFLFASLQTMNIKKNLRKIKPNEYEYVIIDEYHHVACDSYKRLMKYLKPKFVLGMTATPFRLDGRDILFAVEKNVAFTMTLHDGINEGLLSPYVYYALWDNVDYSDIKHKGYRYKEKDLDKKLLIAERDKQVLKQFRKHLKERKTMAFCCSVNHVKRSVKTFNKAGISSVGITYEIPFRERKKIIEDFKNGKYQVLFSKDIFNEGVDFPKVGGLMFLRPTFSKGMFIQQLGRGLRKIKGKKNVLVLDFIGNHVNAFKITEWLTEIMEKGTGSRPTKPLYKYNLKNVFFDKKLIELYELREDITVTKDKLIKEYQRIKKDLGRVPMSTDMDRIGKYNAIFYKNRWGTWGTFVKSQGDRPYREIKNLKRKEMLEFYNKLKKDLGRVPTTRDLKRKKYSKNDFYKVFGSWNELLKQAGDLTEDKIMRRKRWTKKEVVAEYQKTKKRLGKVPKIREIRQLERPIQKFYGSYRPFLKSVGDFEQYDRELRKRISDSQLKSYQKRKNSGGKRKKR